MNIRLDGLFKPEENKRIILSISGGVDSMVLLDVLSKTYPYIDIHLLHFNYSKHSNAIQAEKMIQKLSDKYKYKKSIHRISLKNSNFEHNAREIRYKKKYE